MRLNNLSARLTVNNWLVSTGREAIGAEVGYLEFATRLRGIVASKQVQVPFADRSDAVRYMRLVSADILAGGPMSKR